MAELSLADVLERFREGNPPVTVEQLGDCARELRIEEQQLRGFLAYAEARGLVYLDDYSEPIGLYSAGEQFLDFPKRFAPDVLEFLPGYVDDLFAREALLRAGSSLVTSFRDVVAEGDAALFACDLVPPAFVVGMTETLAVGMFAAAAALMARLSDEHPPGCLAEEIIVVALVSEAGKYLEQSERPVEISPDEWKITDQQLESIFELLGDSDVMSLFTMAEPADAAVAGHSVKNEQLGVADLRVESWFDAFGSVAVTGLLQTRVVDAHAEGPNGYE